MEVSRRDFLRLSVAAGTGTALSGLVGSGVNLTLTVARAQELRIKGAKTSPSLCPYCSVGCATLVSTIEGKIVNIEGDPRSPHNEGTLCPKGAAIFQLHVNPNRPTQVLHRAAGAADWEVWDIERAMARITELVKKTRDDTFIEKLSNGKLVNMLVPLALYRRREWLGDLNTQTAAALVLLGGFILRVVIVFSAQSV